MDRRKIIIITSVLITILLLGGVYWYFSKKTAVTTPGGSFPGESGTTTGVTPGETDGEGELTQFTTGKPLPRLYELHKTPVAGAGFFEYETTAGHALAPRYIEKGLGYIFETPLSSYNETRIVNETRQHLAEALWGNNGNSVIVRFLDPSNDSIIKTRLVTIDSGSSNSQGNFFKTAEIFLPDFIPFVATSDDRSDQLFYLESGPAASNGSISTFDGSRVSRIFSASFTEWLPQLPSQDLVTLTTRPASSVPGYLYFIDQKTKILTKILSGISGLTTLTSRDGKLVIYSETKVNEPNLFLYNTETRESFDLYLKTLPEKCTWGARNSAMVYCAVPQSLPGGAYPDQWYQGLISFSDDLWQIDTATRETAKIMSPGTFKAPELDITTPTISSDDEYLLFVNKTTGTPWVYQMRDEQRFASSPAPAITSTGIPFTPSEAPTTPDMQRIK